MLTDKYLEESGDEVSNEFNSLETLLLVWMGLKLRDLLNVNIEDIENDYPKWKIKAITEFNKYSGTEFSKTKKNALDMVKNTVISGASLTIQNIYDRLKKNNDKLKKKTILTNGKKDLDKGIKDTQNELKNLCNISSKCANKQFIKACDNAYSKIITGQDAEKAIESSIKKLMQSGIEVIGYTKNNTSMDAAVRRAVTSGVNQTSLKIKITNCEKLGINIVKTSSHGGARPDHAKWQGQFFYLNKPVKGLKKFKSSTGYGKVDGIGGSNCRHSFYEVTDYEYKNNLVNTEEFELNRNNEQYELEQEQRYYERQIRKWKKRKNVLDECGIDSTKESKKVRYWQERRSQFIKSSNSDFKKKYGTDNILKKAYPREKVIKKSSLDDEYNKKSFKQSDPKFDSIDKKLLYSDEKEKNILDTFIEIDKKSLSDKFEHLALIDKTTGKKLTKITTDKTAKNVNPSNEMLKIIANAEPYSLSTIHNHPSGSTFSVGDIITLNNVPAFGEMIVINNFGESYYLSIPEGAKINLRTKKNQDLFKEILLNKRKIIKTNNPEISNLDVNHLALKEICKELGWYYGRKRTNS